MSVQARLVQKVTGAVLAGAVADALGWPNEPNSARIGERGPMVDERDFIAWKRFSGTRFMPYEEPIAAGEYSDDTQLTLCVARARLGGDSWLERLREVELPFWLAYQRGGGRTVKSSARAWGSGRPPWDASTKSGAKTSGLYFRSGANGVAMRILPHVPLSETLEELASSCVLDGRLTHGHMRAYVGAVLHAYVLSRALTWEGTLEFGALLRSVAEEEAEWTSFPEALAAGDEWASEFERFHHLPPFEAWNAVCDEASALLQIAIDGIASGSLTDERQVLGALGCLDKATRGSGTSSAVGALFLASRFAADPIMAVREAVSAGGADTDTLGSMVGQIVGALHGPEFLGSLGAQVQDADYMRDIAKRLALRETMKAQSNGDRVTQSAVAKWLRDLPGRDSVVDLLDGREGTVRNVDVMKSRTSAISAVRWTISTSEGQSLFPLVAQRTGNSSEDQTTPVRETPEVSALRLRFYVADLVRSRELYETVIGLRPEQIVDRAVIYQGSLVLAEADPDHFTAGTGAIIVLEVPDLEGSVRRIEERGIKVHSPGPKTYPRFTDYDGHLVELRPSGE